MANSVNPDQTAVCSGSTPFDSILNSSVMLGNYLQQTTLADDIFRCIFILGVLRVNPFKKCIKQSAEHGIFYTHTYKSFVTKVRRT